MRKDEVIQLHALCYRIKEKIKQLYNLDETYFTDYIALRVLPHNIHKSKADHEKACYLLGKELALFFSHDDDYSGFGKTARVLQRLAARLS